MKILYPYLKKHWKLISLALFLAAINITFSLLDPIVFRHVIDEYATRFQEYTTGEFFKGVSLLLGAAVGVAFVSRVAAAGCACPRKVWRPVKPPFSSLSANKKLLSPKISRKPKWTCKPRTALLRNGSALSS